MIVNIALGTAIFGYAGWSLVQFVKKSKKGKCAVCELQNKCVSDCDK